MSRLDRVTNERLWLASVDAYRRLLTACDRLLENEIDPAMLLAGTKVRDEQRVAHRNAIRKLDQVRHVRGDA